MYAAYEQEVQKQFMKEPKEIDTENLSIVHDMQAFAAMEFAQRITDDMEIEVLTGVIDDIIEEAYRTYTVDKENEGNEIKVRNSAITEPTAKLMHERNAAWAMVRKAGDRLERGWEYKMKQLNKRAREIGETEAVHEFLRARDNDQREAYEGLRCLWNKWDGLRKVARNGVTTDKKRQVEKTIESIGQPTGERDIWRAINELCPN